MSNQFYFLRDGTRYTTGTIVYIKGHDVCGKPTKEKMVFLYYRPESGTYFLTHPTSGKTFLYNERMLNKFLIDIPGTVEPSIKEPIKKYRKDIDIEKLYLGWAWYILWMAFATILKEAIAGWAVGSLIFFNWRKKIKEKEGWYYEW